ncbi:MAG TPA: helix-turn-helix domain-containing protein [Stellaceae bacterium]|jgi:hypothetical protein|nr:helix-turn-helix domain-containing protein [Stellaceae bacterium]
MPATLWWGPGDDPGDDLPAEVLAEIEADVARYRNGRIRAARKRLAPPAFVDVTLAELAEIARRWLRGESLRAIAKSLDWDPVSISSTLDAFTVGFRPDFDFDRGTSRRNEVAAALAKFDRGEPPERRPKFRRFSPSHLEQRRATRRATERGSP